MACTCQPALLTFYKQANATKPSAKGPTHVHQNDLHTESKQMPRDHQQEGLHIATNITYFLQGKCHKILSKRSCTCQPEWLTYWEQVNATRLSTRGPAYGNQHHLHPASRQMPQGHQQEGLHMWTQMTNILKAGKCHKAINMTACTCQQEWLTS